MKGKLNKNFFYILTDKFVQYFGWLDAYYELVSIGPLRLLSGQNIGIGNIRGSISGRIAKMASS